MNWKNNYGLSLQGAYTYSHAIDNVSGDLTGISNPFDRNYDKASGNYDRRHIAIFSYVYALPFFAHSQSFLKSAVGGWSISGMTMFETGTPYNLSLGKDNLGLGGGTNSRPNIVSNLAYPQSVDQWFSTSSFAAPANLQFGTAGRNLITGPGRANWNLALFKSFAIPIREGARFQFRAESYNTFNHTQLHDVNTTFTDSNFGKITDAYDPRVLQLGAKLLF